jgi:probable phosphoglycerate mutase
MTKVLLVRHGHVEGISPERFRGRADLALTAEGRRQAEATAQRIQRSWKPAALYTSPMHRCIATATSIGKLFALTPILLPGLNDIDYGQWQGSTPDEVRVRWPDDLTQWYHNPDRAAIPGGERLLGPDPTSASTIRGCSRMRKPRSSRREATSCRSIAPQS